MPPAPNGNCCRNAVGQAHYVVCNADEGEPGTFKDRVLLTSYSDTLFEGMTIAAWTVGASQGLVYLRGEYRYLLEHLQAVLQRRREQGLLGQAIQGKAGFDFDITIHVGAGAYVCGEESALIESLEGKRGVPRIRPPFPVEQRLPGAAHHRQQCGNLLRCHPHCRCTAATGGHASARRSRPAPRSTRSPATANARHLRVPVWHPHWPHSGRLRRTRHAGGTGWRAVRRVPVSVGI